MRKPIRLGPAGGGNALYRTDGMKSRQLSSAGLRPGQNEWDIYRGRRERRASNDFWSQQAFAALRSMGWTCMGKLAVAYEGVTPTAVARQLRANCNASRFADRCSTHWRVECHAITPVEHSCVEMKPWLIFRNRLKGVCSCSNASCMSRVWDAKPTPAPCHLASIRRVIRQQTLAHRGRLRFAKARTLRPSCSQPNVAGHKRSGRHVFSAQRLGERARCRRGHCGSHASLANAASERYWLACSCLNGRNKAPS